MFNKKRTILVVEDDASTAEVIGIALAQETSYNAIIVMNGQDALLVALQYKPDLFILDYRLPDMTGITLYDRLQAHKELRGTPAMLISASQPKEEIAPRDMVMMAKPFELDEFIHTIDGLITENIQLPAGFL